MCLGFHCCALPVSANNISGSFDMWILKGLESKGMCVVLHEWKSNLSARYDRCKNFVFRSYKFSTWLAIHIDWSWQIREQVGDTENGSTIAWFANNIIIQNTLIYRIHDWELQKKGLYNWLCIVTMFDISKALLYVLFNAAMCQKAPKQPE